MGDFSPALYSGSAYSPTATRFTFQLTADGVHGFSIVRLDDSGDIDRSRRLLEWLLNSLSCHGRATEEDAAALEPAASLGGWWGAAVAGEALTGRWGSRLWTLRRAKLVPSTLTRLRELTLEALQWFIDDGIATEVTAEAARVDGRMARLDIVIRRGDETLIAVRFADVWATIQGGASAA